MEFDGVMWFWKYYVVRKHQVCTSENEILLYETVKSFHELEEMA